MTKTCIVHDTDTEKIKVLLVNSDLKGVNDDAFEQVQMRLKKNELLLEMYDCGVECRTLDNAPRIKNEWVLRVISDYYNYPISEWIHNDTNRRPRKRIKVKCRSIAYVMLQKYSGMRLTEIGSLFDKRHHASIINGLKGFRDSLDTDPIFAIEVSEIEEQLTKSIKTPQKVTD